MAGGAHIMSSARTPVIYRPVAANEAFHMWEHCRRRGCYAAYVMSLWHLIVPPGRGVQALATAYLLSMPPSLFFRLVRGISQWEISSTCSIDTYCSETRAHQLIFIASEHKRELVPNPISLNPLLSFNLVDYNGIIDMGPLWVFFFSFCL